MLRLGFYTPTVVLSCDIPDLYIFTDQDLVDFQLKMAGSVLLEGTYYPLDGYVVVGDIGSIIEHHLAGKTDNSLSAFTIDVTAHSGEKASVSFTVLYCERSLDVADISEWLKENFLTLSPIRRIAPDDFINLSWYTTEKEGISFRIYVTYLDDKGNRGTYFYVYSGNGLIAHINGIWNEWVNLSDVRAKIRSLLQIDDFTLQSVTMRCGIRSATFFIDPSLADSVPFYYLNNFGVPEHISMLAVSTEKVKCDRSIATLGKTSLFYDVTTSTEYEVQTGPLTSEECLQLKQMLTAPSVRVPFSKYTSIYETDFDALCPILITDFTCEISDGDDKLHSVKFTWRYSDNRSKEVTPSTPGIFDDKFNPTFS